MNSGTENHTMKGDTGKSEEQLEALFGHATSRPTPSLATTDSVRSAVHQEWSRLARRRKSRKLMSWSIAAAAVLVAAVVAVLQVTGTSAPPDLIEIARVDRIEGQVRVLTQGAEGPGASLAREMPVFIDQELVTGKSSGIALRLSNGISLRLGENSELQLAGEEFVEILSGKVYIDTRPDFTETPGGDSIRDRFEVRTPKGSVKHLGTQYLVRVEGTSVEVGVRKGSVHLLRAPDQPDQAFVVERGQALMIDALGDREVTSLTPFGDNWNWIETLGPGFVLDGRTMAEFLDWVGSETGLEIRYETPEALADAQATTLRGEVELPAREALDLIMLTSDLLYETRNGAIEITTR